MKSMTFSRKLVLILICLTPFAQGLYFYFELFLMVAIAVFGLWWLMNRKTVIRGDKVQMLFFGGCTILSLMTVFFGVDKGMALIGTLKWLGYLFIYLFLQNFMDEDYKEQILKGFSISMGLMNVLGILSFSTGIFGGILLQNGRLGGLIQYPNTYGLLVIMGMMIVWSRPFHRVMKAAYGFIAIIALFMTMSRGVLVILALALMIYLIQKRHEDRWLVLASSGFGGGIGYLTVRVLSGNISGRLAEGLASSEFKTRLLYYLDSVDMILDFPMGLGHLGYYFVQKTYQTGATYGIKFIHNNVLQMTLDIGIIGGILFVAYIGYQLIQAKGMARWMLLIAIIHGFVEFDMQFGVVWLLVILLTIQWKQSGVEIRLMRIEKIWWLKSGTIILIGLLYISATFVTFLQYTNHNALAISLYPLYTTAKIDILSEAEGAAKHLDVAEDLMVSQPFHLTAFVYARDYHFGNKDYDKALEYANMCMDKEPMRISHVEIYSQILLALAYEYKDAADYEAAKYMLEEIFDISFMLEIRRLTLSRNLGIKHQVDFEMTDSLLVDYSQAELLYNWILSQ